MPINKKLIHFNTKLNFLGANGINNATTEDSNGNYGNIPKTSIVFIKDTQEIWTHGLLYGLQLKEVTWSELKALRDWVDPQNANNKGKLIPGLWYRIIDYTCTTAQENTQSAGHVFDIIVRADDKTVLNENAYAAHHTGDTYFADSKLEAWELKYCLDNDTTKFAWADSTNGKGVIYYMKDEWDNECPYDFKNIQYIKKLGFTAYGQFGSLFINTYERYEANDTTVSDTLYYGFKRVSYSSGPPPMDEYVWTTTTALTTSMSLYKISGGNVSSVTGTITKVDLSNFNTYTFDKNGSDASISGGSESITKNSIASYVTGSKQTLNVIYFRSTGTALSAYGNSFNANCHNMSFDYKCYKNSFSYGCCDNSFSYSCYYNSFGSNCLNNSFGNSCLNNSFGNSCLNNSFGNSCTSNSFGDNCSYNSFGDSCLNNSFGSSCLSNSFWSYCSYNSFDNGCYYNSFGNNFNSNSFGNGCKNNMFSKDYSQYNIIEDGNQYITLTSTQTTSSSNPLRNIKICQGVNNTTTTKTISHNTVGDTFQTEYKPANSQVILV